ncbi:hypothetical protein CY0110_16912 [Crocosphaera chwakensis CCY0110]|uniref:Uncharacterized protein n=1 Tax=Crocosphaera chwakensis CCY0110 TaxID=391612 RepID=A3II64_9CHRO|nr:hypothetical protein CY0110_16912 [Crocosphaera chwakensis CCY0110]
MFFVLRYNAPNTASKASANQETRPIVS